MFSCQRLANINRSGCMTLSWWSSLFMIYLRGDYVQRNGTVNCNKKNNVRQMCFHTLLLPVFRQVWWEVVIMHTTVEVLILFVFPTTLSMTNTSKAGRGQEGYTAQSISQEISQALAKILINKMLPARCVTSNHVFPKLWFLRPTSVPRGGPKSTTGTWWHLTMVTTMPANLCALMSMLRQSREAIVTQMEHCCT